MKLRLQPQHFADVREVARVLQHVAAQDPGIVRKFPRPLKKIITLGYDTIKVCFESKKLLSPRVVAHTLRDKYGLQDVPLNEDDITQLAGYIYAVGTKAFIFSDPQYGEAFERFTIAHEAGHLFREFVPQVERAQQQSLFDPPAKPIVLAMRDTPGQLLCAFDSSGWDEAALLAEYRRRKETLREKKADGFAAELLAPFEEVKRLLSVSAAMDHEGHVELIRSHFNISKKAARVRLAELAETDNPDQELLRLLS